MHESSRILRLRTLACCLVLALPAVAQERQVVAYVSMDQEHSERILELFRQRHGIEVKPLFDTEDAKTVGLTNRIIAEQKAPHCDVFWNNEPGQAVRLRDLGLLEPYVSPNAATIPAPFKDPDGYWTGFAARARVLIYNTDLVRPATLPEHLLDLVDGRFKDMCEMSRPLTGTSLTHAAALYEVWGKEKTEAFYKDLDRNGVRWEHGNAQVMREVGNGTRPFGLTDTDDAYVSAQTGRPTATIFLDQEEGGLGTLLIPNTVMVIKGAPHRAEARELVDFLLSAEVEQLLAEGSSAQIPLHPGVPCPANVKGIDTIRAMNVDYRQLGRMIETHGADLEDLFTEKTSGSGLLWAGLGLLVVLLLVFWMLRGARAG